MINQYKTALNDVGFDDSKETLILEKALHHIEDFSEKSLFHISVIEYYWVATALATGALQWIGGNVLEKLFGSSPDQIDVSAIIESAIRRLSELTRQHIEQNAVRQAVAAANSTENNFLDYLRAPTDLRLELTTNDSSRAISELKSLGLVAHSSYMGAVSLKIAILQERVKRYAQNREGELRNMMILIDQALAHHKYMTNQWALWNRSLYVPEKTCKGNFCGVWLWKQGAVLFRAGNTPLAWKNLENFVMEHSERTFREHVYPTFIEPGDEVARQWNLLQTSIQIVIGHGNFNPEFIMDITKKIASGVHPTELI